MSIGQHAFAYCSELLDVYCYAEKVPSTKSNAFDGSYPEYATLHVPDASIDSYKATAPWSGFGKIVPLTEEETGIDEQKGENIGVKTAVYEELPGWQTDLTQMTSPDQFPKAFQDYIDYLEKALERPITIVSVGPDRAQTIER